jgi:hypothetical protein
LSVSHILQTHTRTLRSKTVFVGLTHFANTHLLIMFNNKNQVCSTRSRPRDAPAGRLFLVCLARILNTFSLAHHTLTHYVSTPRCRCAQRVPGRGMH